MRLEKLGDGSVTARNFDRVEQTHNELSQFVYWGDGVPTFTPVDPKGTASRALYIRRDGGTSTTLYVYEGASWVAK